MAKVWLRIAVGTLLAAAIGACAPPPPQPRTVLDFMEDGLAREGVLTRCNHDRDATLQDVECSNARRAAAALAIEAERERAGALEQQSERKFAALRELATREAAAAAASAGARANESSFGSPIGPVLPSISESTRFDVFAEGQEPLGRPSLDVEDAAPPANDFEIVEPQIGRASCRERVSLNV